MPEYIIILLSFFLVGFALQKAFSVTLFKSLKHALIFYLAFLVIGIVWDTYAIAKGHWSFGPNFMTGMNIGIVPLEDYAFIFIMSYFGLVLYKISEKYSK